MTIINSNQISAVADFAKATARGAFQVTGAVADTAAKVALVVLVPSILMNVDGLVHSEESLRKAYVCSESDTTCAPRRTLASIISGYKSEKTSFEEQARTQTRDCAHVTVVLSGVILGSFAVKTLCNKAVTALKA